jgi:cellulose synthase/poly-beta-1,6-N-acetylglucosamine synthase-like glycosyltransferase
MRLDRSNVYGATASGSDEEQTNRMSLGLDPIVSSLFYSLSLVPHLKRPARGTPSSTRELAVLPYVSVLVTFCQETRADIEMTVSSFLAQTYPSDRFEVLMAIEPDDEPVARYAAESVSRLREAGVVGKIVVSDGKIRIKPHALNLAVRLAQGKYCAFYDAADIIDDDQVEKAVRLMEEHDYDVMQSAVFRKGRSVLSQFLMIDTIFWYRKYLPLLLRHAQGFPLSGEGLFIRKSVLDEAGGFPEVLTEDAYLGLLLSERGRRFGIVDSVVVEKAPRNAKAHFIQRSRWHRGYLTCLRRLFRSKLSFRRKFFFLMPLIAPLSCSLAFLGWTSILCYAAISLVPGTHWKHGIGLPFESQVLSGVVYYWSLVLACVGIPLILLSYTQVLWEEEERPYMRVLPLIPLYWMFVGFVATCSFFRSTKKWGKTER